MQESGHLMKVSCRLCAPWFFSCSAVRSKSWIRWIFGSNQQDTLLVWNSAQPLQLVQAMQSWAQWIKILIHDKAASCLFHFCNRGHSFFISPLFLRFPRTRCLHKTSALKHIPFSRYKILFQQLQRWITVRLEECFTYLCECNATAGPCAVISGACWA